jgi:hypothetical protein
MHQLDSVWCDGFVSTLDGIRCGNRVLRDTCLYCPWQGLTRVDLRLCYIIVRSRYRPGMRSVTQSIAGQIPACRLTGKTRYGILPPIFCLDRN